MFELKLRLSLAISNLIITCSFEEKAQSSLLQFCLQLQVLRNPSLAGAAQILPTCSCSLGIFSHCGSQGSWLQILLLIKMSFLKRRQVTFIGPNG